jgi:hypothetical protein
MAGLFREARIIPSLLCKRATFCQRQNAGFFAVKGFLFLKESLFAG